jgi:hypothetical protein
VSLNKCVRPHLNPYKNMYLKAQDTLHCFNVCTVDPVLAKLFELICPQKHFLKRKSKYRSGMISVFLDILK